MKFVKSKKVWVSVAILVVIAIALFCFTPLFSQSKSSSNQPVQPAQENSAVHQGQNQPQEPVVVPSSFDSGLTFDEAVKMKKPMAVNFYVDWCGYCQKFAPILNQLSQEYKGKMNFVLVNVENPKNKKLVDDYMITGFPTLYLVNPKNDNRVFLNQSIYANSQLMKREFDRFLRVNK